jgi:dTDP-4-amino-4,6-dideoxygalactose transaminase
VTPAAAPPAALGVPFFDLEPMHAPLARGVLDDVAGLIADGAFVNGPAVARFEQAFARFAGTDDCVAVGSGLDALRLALLALEIEPGDEVIVPALTFAATLEAVTQAGGTPVVVDVEEGDLNIDPAAVEAAVGPRTRVVAPVHLYGRLADLRRLVAVATRGRVAIVEDACQAHGAERHGIPAGATGVAGAFSFYPAKNLGAFGDAGAVVTSDEGLASRVRALREHGQRRKYEHEREGFTARMDTIQALVLLRKLPLLGRWNEERRACARYYDAHLRGVGDLVLPPLGDADSVWHLYVVRTAEPERLAAHLRERGIGTGRHYPHPVHLLPPYERLGHRAGAFPVAERAAASVLSLPLFPGMSEEQLATVVASLRAFFDGS